MIVLQRAKQRQVVLRGAGQVAVAERGGGERHAGPKSRLRNSSKLGVRGIKEFFLLLVPVLLLLLLLLLVLVLVLVLLHVSYFQRRCIEWSVKRAS